jgi:hypothetical protein
MPQLDGLVLFLFNPATHPPTHPNPHPGKFIFEHFSANVDQVSSQELEDDLNSLTNLLANRRKHVLIVVF